MIVAMMPTRGDAWCIGFSIRVLLEWVDKVLVFYHCPDDCSADETFEILKGLSDAELQRVTVVGETKPEWDEMRHRQAMLEIGRAMGGTHFVIADSDEFLTANLLPTIRQLVHRLTPRQILQVPLYNVRHGIDSYHSNGLWSNRITSAVFCDHPLLCYMGDKYHSREPVNALRPDYPQVSHGAGGIVHLWGASERRLHAKHVTYRLIERLRYPDRAVSSIEEMYSWAEHDRAPMRPEQWSFTPIPLNWFDGYGPWMAQYLCVDRLPWQEEFNRGLLEKHGRDHFAGLTIG